MKTQVATALQSILLSAESAATQCQCAIRTPNNRHCSVEASEAISATNWPPVGLSFMLWISSCVVASSNIPPGICCSNLHHRSAASSTIQHAAPYERQTHSVASGALERHDSSLISQLLQFGRLQTLLFIGCGRGSCSFSLALCCHLFSTVLLHSYSLPAAT